MSRHDSLVLALTLATATAHAESAPAQDVVIAPESGCIPHEHAWTLTRESRLAVLLKELANLTCESFFVTPSLLDEKLAVDVGNEALSPFELHQRVEGALRSKGIVLSAAHASRVQRASSGTPPPTAPRISPDKLDKGIKCAANRCTLSREVVDAMLSDTSGLAAGARIVPAFKDGRSVGFKLFGIRAGGYFARLGLQNGDVVLALDGLPLTSPDKALEAYSHVRSQRQVTVDVERRGEKMAIEYTVK